MKWRYRKSNNKSVVEKTISLQGPHSNCPGYSDHITWSSSAGVHHLLWNCKCWNFQLL